MTQTNPLTQLQELWDLHEAWVAKGMDPWWPGMVWWHVQNNYWYYGSCRERHESQVMDPPDALTLVVAAGERVLGDRGYMRERGRNDVAYSNDGYVTVHRYLPDALRAVMEAHG